MLSALWAKIKEIVQRMLPKKSIENILSVSPVLSDRMVDAIQLWSDMYIGCSPWIREPSYEDPVRIVSLGLPALIASEKARMVTLEMKSEISPPFEKEQPQTDTPPVATDMNQQKLPVEPNTSSEPANSNLNNTIPAGKTNGVATERAEFLEKNYKKVLKQIRRQLEYGIAKGGLVIKPYIVLYESEVAVPDAEKTQNSAFNEKPDNESTNNTTQETSSKSTNKITYAKKLDRAEIEFDFIQADRFFPLSFDANGKVVEAAFVQIKTDKAKERVYIRLEYHKLENRKVIVQNLAFESPDMSLADSSNIKCATNLGTQIPLTNVPEWANLQPVTEIKNVDRLLFAYFKMPEANTVDPYSPLGVSGFSRVVQLIKDADMQYSRLLWEYEGGELAIDVDRDALKFITDPLGSGGQGMSVLPQKQQRLFRKVDLNAEDTYNVFAPNLRDVSIVNGLNNIFMRIEDATGLSRGTISEVRTSEARTATELKILKQRSYATNADIQMALQDALEDAIYVMDVYCDLYNVTPPGDYEVSFEWDDSIIVDSESELSKRITLMQNGLASKLETRMWYYGETESQALAALARIEEEAMQAAEQKAAADALSVQAVNGGEIPSGEEEESDEEESEDEETERPVNDKRYKDSRIKSPADKTSDRTATGKQADSLKKPIKTPTDTKIKDEDK